MSPLRGWVSTFRLRHYFAGKAPEKAPPIVLVPPLMMATEVWDVSPATSGVAALHAAGRSAEAIDHLLESFRRDRDWNEGAAKAQLLTLFDALPATDPLVQKGRRRLSSLIFA